MNLINYLWWLYTFANILSENLKDFLILDTWLKKCYRIGSGCIWCWMLCFKILIFLENWQCICIIKCFVSMWLFWGLSDGFVTTFFVYQFSHWITIMLIKKWHIQRICSMSSQVISMKSLSFWFMCQLPFLVPQSDEARTSTSFCLIASPVKLCRRLREIELGCFSSCKYCPAHDREPTLAALCCSSLI